MLDKLVESKDHKIENKFVKRLLLTISTLVVSGFVFALVFSLFNQTLAMETGELNVYTLTLPVQIPENKPPMPEPAKKAEKSVNNTKTVVPTRKANIMRVDESPKNVPNKVSTKPQTGKSRPEGNYRKGLEDIDSNVGENKNSNAPSGNLNGSLGEGFGNKGNENSELEKPKPTPEINKPKETPPPPPTPKPTAEPKVEKPKQTVISGGVVNGKAIKLVQPIYPAAAKSIQLRGQVTVQVTIDENGRVISAQAVNGHKLLTNNAVAAARQSLFNPTTLSGQKVKVNGMIIYNFN